MEPTEVLEERVNVVREVSSLEEKASAPVVTCKTLCQVCGFKAHEIAAEEVVLSQNYVQNYLMSVYQMPCPNCGMGPFETHIKKA